MRHISCVHVIRPRDSRSSSPTGNFRAQPVRPADHEEQFACARFCSLSNQRANSTEVNCLPVFFQHHDAAAVRQVLADLRSFRLQQFRAIDGPPSRNIACFQYLAGGQVVQALKVVLLKGPDGRITRFPNPDQLDVHAPGPRGAPAKVGDFTRRTGAIQHAAVRNQIVRARGARFGGAGFDSALRRGLTGVFEQLPVAPQPFQVIEYPGVFREDVNDQIEIVHQDPLGIPVALDMIRLEASFFHPQFHLVRNGLDLPGRVAGTYQEVIGKRSDLGNVQDDNVVSLLIVYGFEGHFQRICHRSP